MSKVSLKVPRFSVGRLQRHDKKYTFWGWHPNYPYWSCSCWGGATKAQAFKELKRANDLKLYAIRLVKEVRGKFKVVWSRPCLRMDVWKKIRDSL